MPPDAPGQPLSPFTPSTPTAPGAPVGTVSPSTPAAPEVVEPPSGGVGSPASPGTVVPSSPGNAPSAPGQPLGSGPGNAPSAPGTVIPVEPGTPAPSDSVRFSPQTLTEPQQDQARLNIGAAKDGIAPFGGLTTELDLTGKVGDGAVLVVIDGQSHRCLFNGSDTWRDGVDFSPYYSLEITLSLIGDEISYNLIDQNHAASWISDMLPVGTSPADVTEWIQADGPELDPPVITPLPLLAGQAAWGYGENGWVPFVLGVDNIWTPVAANDPLADHTMRQARLAGVDGLAIAEGSDGGVIFRWISATGGPDRGGVGFDFGSVHQAWFNNYQLTANRDYYLPNRSGTMALLEGAQTFSGSQTFSGQVELTGTAMSSDNAAMARKDAGHEVLANVAMVKTPRAFTLVASGTGATQAVSGDEYALFSGTAANGYARYVLARNLSNGNAAWTGAGMDCSKNFDIALSVSAYLPDVGQVARILFGAPANPIAGDTAQSLTGKGWGLEMRRSAGGLTTVEFRLVAYDSGWAISSTALSVVGYGDATILLRKDGSTVKLWKSSNRTGRIDVTAAPYLTLLGAPATGSEATTFCVAEVANPSTVPSATAVFRITSGPNLRIYQ